MPVFMDDIAKSGKAEHTRKIINNCARVGNEKKVSFGLKKTKCIVKTGREEEINKTAKAGRLQRRDKYKYLEITVSMVGQLTEQIKELNNRCDIIMPGLLYGMEAWKKLSKAEIQYLEKIQGKAFKMMFNLPITTPYIGPIIEKTVWLAEQRISYSSFMLYHNIINSSKDRLAKEMIQEQRAQNHQNNFYEKVRRIIVELNIKLEAAVTKEIRMEKKNKR